MRDRDTAAFVKHITEFAWEQPPIHSAGALSKMLVRPENCPGTRIDYRISVYQPSSHVEPHSHRDQEQIYHVLEGEGMVEMSGKRHHVSVHTVLYIPPGVRHTIVNTGLRDLVFIVVTAPPDGRVETTSDL